MKPTHPNESRASNYTHSRTRNHPERGAKPTQARRAHRAQAPRVRAPTAAFGRHRATCQGHSGVSGQNSSNDRSSTNGQSSTNGPELDERGLASASSPLAKHTTPHGRVGAAKLSPPAELAQGLGLPGLAGLIPADLLTGYRVVYVNLVYFM
ncbi:hypothetical protein KSP39_PZI012262 [Platanthera zijinensis]|uniref:Uncharacterized protein n=1 Tax=Platanthera zijinensis TaxID=2320716 RepID=A0AAP0BFM9_9ASPA